ncbi:MAG TPA: terminase family protein, partial [Salinarimonas sp.]|nr:terminase family protein [Salinarimonas sp.]
MFFGGARGGGKTDGVLGEFIEHADAYGEHAIGLMVRRQRTELIETIERSKQIYGQLGWTFHEQDKMWRAPNGARLRFAYLERDADAEAYQGHSYTRVYVEEIGNFPSDKPILKLMATLRSGAGVPVGFRATGNPGGPGHTWVKARYIDPCPTGMVPFNDPVSGLERVFIPSKVQDNQYLGEQYIQQLRASGSKELVRAWLEGDWSVIEGAFFDCWSNEKHVIRPFEIPKDWLRFRSMDWGSARPFSVGWWAVAGDDHVLDGGGVIPRGAMVRYRE